MRRCLAAILLAAALPAADWSDSPAFQEFYNLRYDRALELIEKQLAGSPRDPNLHNFLAYTILYRRLYLAGALDSSLALDIGGFQRRGGVEMTAEEKTRFEGAVQKAIQLGQERIAANARDPEALYALGVANVHRASYAYLVKKSWREALSGASSARKFHQRALEANPSLADALLLPSVHDYIVGSLPAWVKAVVFLAGFRGDKEGGLRGIERVAREGKSVQVEGQVILSLFYRREKQIDRAMPIMIALAARFPSNYLYRMELTRQLLEAGRAQDALRELAVLEEGARPGGRYANVSQERMLTLRADVLTAARDWDRALEALARLEALSGGTQATRAKAWLKRGYVYDLKGDRAQALAAYRQAIRLAPESEWAEQSRRYLNKPFKV